MLMFERSYDDFMILCYDKVMITNFQSWNLRDPKNVKKKDHLTTQCHQIKQTEYMLPQLKPLTPVVTCHVTSSSWPEYSISNTQSPLRSKCFHCSCYITHYACFYVMRQWKCFISLNFFNWLSFII